MSAVEGGMPASEAAAPVAPAAAPRPLLAQLGDPAAAACDGDSCVVPA
ncbi:hypothetical protein [Leifsonia shinshuensis]